MDLSLHSTLGNTVCSQHSEECIGYWCRLPKLKSPLTISLMSPDYLRQIHLRCMLIVQIHWLLSIFLLGSTQLILMYSEVGVQITSLHLLTV